MNEIRVLEVELNDQRSYPIYIGAGLLSDGVLRQYLPSRQVLIITDEHVAPLYLERLATPLRGDYHVEILILPAGEQHKTLATVTRIFDTLLTHRFNRQCTLVALGGGVIGDMVGFAAACYQRGVAFIQIPTTLLAQVDSSVGGKTGVNHPLGKNMIGAFHQPRCVIADTTTLETLEDRQLSAGIAEVIKYGLIGDREFWDWLNAHLPELLAREPHALAYAIERSCANKARIVAADEKETGLRAILNFGHTFGHAIETGTGYGEYLHGEAVAIGMALASALSQRLGWLSASDCQAIRALLQRARLPIAPPAMLDAEQFLALMAVDKKNTDGQLRLILLKALGEATLPTAIDTAVIRQSLIDYGRDG